MTTCESWDRSRRIAAAASVLTLIALAVGVLALGSSVSVPDTWWPHTGQAFSAGSRPGHAPRALPPGRANAHCGSTASFSATRHSATGALWKAVPAGAGLAALGMWGRRAANGRRRR
ncbi:hypothetical protein ACH41H_44020 [Streptomyces sp. NPDC020800]|uniref:hypothetical protein n=1 Tax=Streptomyces sp. NPDC020800 TaxID=3365092 RepID=UPI0037BB9552